MNFYFSWLKSFILAASLLFSVNSFAKIQEVKNLKDQIGELNIKNPPKRVISLSLSAMEMMDILGIKPVGIPSTASGGLPIYLSKKMEGITNIGSLAQPSLERIQSLKPDLIIIDRAYEEQRELIDKLEKIAPVVNCRAHDYKKILENLKIFATLFNKEKEAENFINKFNSEVKETKETAKKHPTSMLAFFVSNNKIFAWNDKSFLASLLTEVNVDYAYKEAGNKDYIDFKEVSIENILDVDPDQIIVFKDPGKNIIEYLSKNPVWKSLRAVKNNHVIEVDRDIWSRSRGPLAAETIVKEMRTIIK